MYIAFIILAVLFILFLLYLLSLAGQRGRVDKDLSSEVYAHRGLHKKPYIPENSLAAFLAAVDKGYGIELDVHLTADGGLAVIHDSSLKRTAGEDVRIESLSLSQLKNYHLEGTEEKIPTFNEVLELVDGKVPLVIELKVEGNAGQLCTAVWNTLQNYNGKYCIESFDPRCLMWFRKNAPKVIRGQLSQNFIKEPSGNLSLPLRIVLTSLILNFITQPDFIAYKFTHRGDFSFKIATRLWKISAFSWTIKELSELEKSEKEGMTPIFENFEP